MISSFVLRIGTGSGHLQMR